MRTDGGERKITDGKTSQLKSEREDEIENEFSREQHVSFMHASGDTVLHKHWFDFTLAGSCVGGFPHASLKSRAGPGELPRRSKISSSDR